MDSPFLLLLLLVLPIAVAAIIVAVSRGRRRGRPRPGEPATEPVHRFQSGTAAAQDAVVRPAAVAPRAESARMRRAASAVSHDQG